MKIKSRIWIYPLILVGFVLILFNSCKKDESSPLSSLIDIDGNVYDTVTIGTQVWMAENLKTTKYNDGAPIPLVTGNSAWANLTTPGYCFYDNDAGTNKATYGAIYNWYTVNTGKLCPTGWHVPTDIEWIILTQFLGGEPLAGGELKETGTIHWSSPNEGATNSSGFTALPGGYRQDDGSFYNINDDDFWWSSTESTSQITKAWSRGVNYNYPYVYADIYLKSFGYSVRCLKN
jgi:uncharacterized protein (TIGR02145 family)